MLEVEAEKAVQEIEAPEAGVLARILIKEGKTVAARTPIAVIAEASEDISELLASIAAG